MFKQGASKETVTKTIKRTYGRHEVLKQFATNASALANQLLIKQACLSTFPNFILLLVNLDLYKDYLY